jgi:hypothetical protein
MISAGGLWQKAPENKGDRFVKIHQPAFGNVMQIAG